MLMSDNKKKIVTTLIGRLKGDKEEMSEAPSKDGVEQDSSVGYHSAMDEFISAVHSKDAKKAHSALKSYMDMCEDEEESKDPADASNVEPVSSVDNGLLPKKY